MADWTNEFLSKKQVYLRLRKISEDYGRYAVDKQSAIIRCIDAVMEMPSCQIGQCFACRHAGMVLCRFWTNKSEGVQFPMQQDAFCSYFERKQKEPTE